MELRRFFDRAVRATFRDLTLHDELVAGYLVDLLTRFAHTDQLFPAGVAVPRLEAIVDVLLEAQAAWDDASPHFSPEREVSARRHLGDYALFMTGVFRERVERLASTAYYVGQGQRAYRFVSEHDRASARPTTAGGGPLFARLAERFESYAWALDYARRVHFREAPAHPFFGLGFN